MKTLTLIRHAKSSWSDPDARDHERTLNRRGQQDAPEMGIRLAEQLQPDLILCSDAQRAQETAQLLVPAMGLSLSDIILEPRIYEATPGSLLDVVQGSPAAHQHILLIGHNPGLEQLCNWLLPGAIERMPTCAVSSFSIESNTWSELLGKPVSLLLHDFPKNR